MLPFLRQPFMRSHGGAAVPTLSSAFVTVLGIRVTRVQILRVSGLLALRSLSGAIEIPLDDGVQAYLWGFLLSSAQAGVALATAASIFEVPVLSRFFPRVGDGPFLTLYGRIVAILGPVVAWFETAVLVYEVMQLSRRVEQHMHSAEERGNEVFRPLMIFVSVAALACAGVMAYVCGGLGEGLMYVGAGPIVVAALGLLAVAVGSDDGNVVEGSFLALYAAGVWCMGVAEEAALDAQLVPALREREVKEWAVSEDVRAVMLVCSLASLLVTMSRAERFIKIVSFGYEAVVGGEEEGSQQQLQQHGEQREGEGEDGNQRARHDDNDDDDDDDDDGDGDVDDDDDGGGRRRRSRGGSDRGQRQGRDDNRRRRRRSASGGGGGGGGVVVKQGEGDNKVLKAFISTGTLLAATFRILMWAGQVDKDEYIPIGCRGWQVFMTLMLYVFYSQM